MTALMILGIISLSLWVALRYKAPGAIGMGGVGIAGLVLVQDKQTTWEVVAFAATAGLFVIGMFVKTDKDDLFHWAALPIGLLKWVGIAVAWLADLSFWSSMAKVPTIVIVSVSLLLIGGFVAYVVQNRQLHRQREATLAPPVI